jgi:hypothetical protein
MNSKFFKFENGKVHNVDYIVSVDKYKTESAFTFKEDGGTYTLRMTLQDYDNFVERFAV